jgi:hypothetical protein
MGGGGRLGETAAGREGRELRATTPAPLSILGSIQGLLHGGANYRTGLQLGLLSPQCLPVSEHGGEHGQLCQLPTSRGRDKPGRAAGNHLLSEWIRAYI